MTDDAIRAALAEELTKHYPGPDRLHENVAYELLPTVRRLMQQQAAEELHRAAEDLFDAACFAPITAVSRPGPIADWLRARADRLAPEPAP